MPPHFPRATACLLLAASALAVVSQPAHAKKKYDGVTISQSTLKSRCEGAGGSFSDLGDGRVVCKIHGIVVVCILALNICESNEARTAPSRLPRRILGGTTMPLGTGDGSPSSEGGGHSMGSNDGPRVN